MSGGNTLGISPIQSQLITNRRVLVDSSNKFIFRLYLNSSCTLLNLCWLSLFLKISFSLTALSPFVYVVLIIAILSNVLALFTDCVLWIHREDWVTCINYVTQMTELVHSKLNVETVREVNNSKTFDIPFFLELNIYSAESEKMDDNKFVQRVHKTSKALYIFLFLVLCSGWLFPILLFHDAYRIFSVISKQIGWFINISPSTFEPSNTAIMILYWTHWNTICVCLVYRCAIWLILAFVGGGSIMMVHLKIRGKILLNWYSPKNTLSHPDYASKVYIIISLIFKILVVTANHLLGLVAIICMGLASLTLYFVVGSKGQITERLFILSVFFITNFLLFIFNLLSKNYIYSKKLLNSWKYDYIGSAKHKSTRWEIESRRLRAMLPMKFTAGSTCFIDGMVSAKIVDTIIDKTIFLLSAFPLH